MANLPQPRCWFCGQYVASRDGLSEEGADASSYAEERDAYITERLHLCPREGK